MEHPTTTKKMATPPNQFLERAYHRSNAGRREERNQCGLVNNEEREVIRFFRWYLLPCRKTSGWIQSKSYCVTQPKIATGSSVYSMLTKLKILASYIPLILNLFYFKYHLLHDLVNFWNPELTNSESGAQYPHPYLRPSFPSTFSNSIALSLVTLDWSLTLSPTKSAENFRSGRRL